MNAVNYVLIYEDKNKQIRNEVVTGAFTKRIKEIESEGGWFLRVMSEKTYQASQKTRKRIASWNR